MWKSKATQDDWGLPDEKLTCVPPPNTKEKYALAQIKKDLINSGRLQEALEYTVKDLRDERQQLAKAFPQIKKYQKQNDWPRIQQSIPTDKKPVFINRR